MKGLDLEVRTEPIIKLLMIESQRQRNWTVGNQPQQYINCAALIMEDPISMLLKIHRPFLVLGKTILSCVAL